MPLVEDNDAETLLDLAENDLKSIVPSDTTHTELWREAEQHVEKVVELRWTLIAESGGIIYMPLLLMLVVWLMVVFASLGFRAPRNSVVLTTLTLSALLISASLYLVLDMDSPFTAPIGISSAPVQRAIDYMKR